MLTNLTIILRWIARYWFPSVPYEKMSNFIDLWISLIRRWFDNSGSLSTIKRIKAIRLATTRYICGSPLKVNTDRLSVTEDGFPTCIVSIKELVDSKHPESLRFVLTCLGISRSFTFPGKEDLSSITKEFSGSLRTIDQEFVETFVKDFCGTFDPLHNRPSPFISYLSMKAGPMIGPAILTAHVAASRFTGVNLWGLAGIGGDKFMEWVKELKSGTTLDLTSFLKKVSNRILDPNSFRWGNRKFIRIDDPEAKVRIVGCYDYISQLALTPYSEWAFNALRVSFPKDRTFTQDPVITDKKETECYHSLDLSAATDRFPITLQVQMLAVIAGPAFAGYWKNLMVSEPFQHFTAIKGYDTKRLVNISYSVGQPMGARSSWATFTLAHHMVVQYAAFLNDQYPFSDYILLGDDVVIYNDKVAKTYTELIRSLGVEISNQKSHVSIDTYEFAKRWFQSGIEISPVPIAGFVSNWNNPKLLYSQLLELIYKGRGPRSIVDSLDMIENLLSRLTKPTDKHFMDHIPLGGLFRQERAYSSTQVKYGRRAALELQLTLRNMREFDEERTRSFMANATKSNDYIIPSNLVSLIQEWNRASSGVVNGMAMSVIKDLSTYFKRYKEAYIDANSNDSWDCRVSLGSHPLTIAIYGSVKRYHLMNKAMGYTTDLSKQLETVTLLNLDKLRTQERNSEELIFTYSTFGRKLSRQLRDDPDLIIAKARTMQFGRSLMDIQLAMAKEFPLLKAGVI
jgi:hypothetical protein